MKDIAIKFVEWLTANGYWDIADVEDFPNDVMEIAEDLVLLKGMAPRIYNLLASICDFPNRAYLDDYSKVDALAYEIMKLLPKTPERGKFWSNGEEILSEDRGEVETIANLFDQLYGVGIVGTGYYDPEEDAKSDCVDEYTGWHYVTFQ